MLDNKEILDQINVVSGILGLDDFVIEKDVYVTQAISIAAKVLHDDYELVFQGGTCLAKAHRIIKRMSEDCDFRIKAKKSTHSMSKEKKRKSLRNFRREILSSLRASGFEVANEEIRVRNEGQFMSIRVRYPSMFETIQSIKPFISVDFFLCGVKTPAESKKVTTLIKQTLGEKVSHEEFPINSVSVIETAAEKWVALTRRIATMSHRNNYRDNSLIRHLYDLYKIEQQSLFTDKFAPLSAKILQDDRRQYKNHNDAYYRDPIKEIKRSIKELHELPMWKENWQQFMDTMVFDKEKPAYDAALENLINKTDNVLAYLKNFKS